MDDKIKELREKREGLEKGGGDKATLRQRKRGKLTARERIEILVDPGSFSEIDLFAAARATGFDVDKREMPADAVIVGSAEIDSRPVYLYAQDFTVMGGTVGSVHARKVIKVMEKALKMRVPLIGLIDSGGVRVQDAVSREYRNSYHSMFYLHTLSSGVIPQISLMMGPCAAGASYSPILTDFCLMVRGTSYMYIASPPLIKSVTSEEVTSEELGGADIHATISGCCDLVAEDDEHCLNLARRLLGYLPLNNEEEPPILDTGDDPDRECPEIHELVPMDHKKPYDVRAVIETIIDRDEFFELKPDWAMNMVVGMGRLDGRTVGVVANQPAHVGGAIDINAADKEASTRSTEASSDTGPRSSSPSPSQPCQRSPCSPEKATAAARPPCAPSRWDPTWSSPGRRPRWA